MIRTSRLSRIFSTPERTIKAVDGIDVVLPDKGMVFIIGKSGSGKSTFLNLLAGYDSPSEGSIFVNGKDIAQFSQQELSDYQFQDLGFVFQNYSLIENISVYQNIAIGSKNIYKKEKAEIDSILMEVGLNGYGKRLVSKLSGGEKQRVALARAIIKRPKIILSDEPCGNLDSVSSKLVLRILKKQAEHSLVVIVSHNLNDAYTYADRVITLKNGHLDEDKVYDESRAAKGEEVKYVTDFNELSEEEVEKINEEMSQGSLKGIYRRKDFFVDNEGKEDLVEGNGEQEEKRKSHFVPAILAIINRNKLKVGMFSLLIGLALALFSICFSVESFNGDRFFATAFDNYNYNAVSYNKGIAAGGEDSQYATTLFSPITEEDRALVKNSGYTGNAYELYNISLFTSPAESELTMHRITRRIFLTSLNFQSFYTLETGGILVTNEDFIKQNLDLKELNVTYAPTLEDSGVLITDYVADAFVSRMSDLYPNREALLGKYSDPQFYYDVYINGIIDTDYEERFKELRNRLSGNSNNYLSLLDEENIELYEFLKNSLNIAYSTNPDFREEYLSYNHVVGKHGIRYFFKDGTELELDPLALSYSTSLPDNTVMVNIAPLRSIYPGLSLAEIEEVINEGEGKVAFELLEWNSANTRGIDLNWDRYEFDYIHVYEEEDEYYNAESCPMLGRRNYVSKNIYEQIAEESLYSFAFYMDDVDGAIALQNSLRNNSLYPSSELYAAAMDLTDAISTFGSIFLLLSLASAAIAFLIVSYYGVNLVSANKYNIGVFKALGYRGKELTLYYLITLLIFFLLVAICYVAFYSLFLSIANDVLINSLISYLSEKATYFTRFGIFAFSPSMIFSVLGAFIGLLGIITLVYLLVLRKFRAIKILQDKD